MTISRISKTIQGQVASFEQSLNAKDEVYFTGEITGADGGTYGVVAVPFECAGSEPRCNGVTIYANFDWGSQPDGAALQIRSGLI